MSLDESPSALPPDRVRIRESGAFRLVQFQSAQVLSALLVFGSYQVGHTAEQAGATPQSAAQAYLNLLENFTGFAEQYWNAEAQSYDASGAGVTWARGNGGMCLTIAVLLTEYPDRELFTPKRIPRQVLFDHARRAIRTLCFTSNVCTDPRAVKPGKWGGPDPNPKRGGWHWQAGLETEHWVLATHLLAAQLDDDTLALVKQVAGAEADGAANRPIQSARPGDTAADDCSWNAGILGVCAAIYADDPRAKSWDEWAKRWALNMEGREPDRKSQRLIDGKPLGEWLVSTNAFPDLTIVNHGFWDLPYQTCFADLSEAILAYKMCNRPIPEAFHANVLEEGDQILKWLAMPDGDLLCPQGIDWAERDVQHSWAYTILGTLLDQPWALAAEARCIDLLTRRQAAFGDGSIHALDFGYQTDLARVWTASFLWHKYFGKLGNSGREFEEPRGAKLYPYVATAVFRTPDLASSVTWYPKRQAIMVSPTNLAALGERTAFTRWDHESGTGWIAAEGDQKHRGFMVRGEPRIEQKNGALAISFTRQIPGLARQQISYCALPSGAVAVGSRWKALKDANIAELVDHPFRWVEIDKFISKPKVEQSVPGVWNIDDKLQLQVFADVPGELAADGIHGAVRRDFSAKAGDVLLNSICVYQPIVAGRSPVRVEQEAAGVRIGDQLVRRGSGGMLSLESPSSGQPPADANNAARSE
ncbi:MAG: hypothetical protein WD468_10590 [Pirellulales bacterium]